MYNTERKEVGEGGKKTKLVVVIMNLKFFSSRQKKTPLMSLNTFQEESIIGIMNKYPIFELETDDFNGRVLSIGVNVTVNKRGSTKNFKHEIERFWLPEIIALGRYYNFGYGVIPYQFYKNSVGKIIPKIKKPGTGQVRVYYDINEGETKYIWISDFRVENTTTFRADSGVTFVKYCPNVHFYVVKGKCPDHHGNFHSKLSKLVRKFDILMKYFELTTSRDMKILQDPMIIEHVLPKTDIEMKYMEKQREMEVKEDAETDFRFSNFQDMDQTERETYSSTTTMVNQINKGENGGLVKSHKVRILDDTPLVPIKHGMYMKLPPGQKYQKYDVQKLQMNYEQLEDDFERRLTRTLGSMSWHKDAHRSFSDAYLVSEQRFMATSTESELSAYEGLIVEWFLRLYGGTYLTSLEIYTNMNQTRKRLKSKGKKKTKKRKTYDDRDDYDRDLLALTNRKRRKIMRRYKKRKRGGIILNEKEIEFVKLGGLNFEAKFTKRSTIVRPGYQDVDKLYFAGAIDDDQYREVQTNLHGIPLKKNISPTELFIGIQKSNGIWVDEQSLRKQLMIQQNPEKYGLVNTAEMMKRASGGGGGGMGRTSDATKDGKRTGIKGGGGRQQQRGKLTARKTVE